MSAYKQNSICTTIYIQSDDKTDIKYDLQYTDNTKNGNYFVFCIFKHNEQCKIKRKKSNEKQETKKSKNNNNLYQKWMIKIKKHEVHKKERYYIKWYRYNNNHNNNILNTEIKHDHLMHNTLIVSSSKFYI